MKTAEGDGADFETLKLDPNLLKGIHHLGFLRPTPIQTQAIPPILAGRDVIGLAQTGTGKTAAFVLPILHRLLRSPSCKSPRALIIAPTRELALQSMDHLKALSRFVHLKGTAIFGGVSFQPQISAIQNGIDILSATPGRLLDHVEAGRLKLSKIETFVLDEVDQMLNMGFLPAIQKIIQLLPSPRQNLVFSATLSAQMSALVHKILTNPVTVQVGQRSSAATGIRHAVYPVPRHLKIELLVDILRGQGMTSVLIFTRTKRNADRLGLKLQKRGFVVSVIHGDRNQNQRLRALSDFRSGRSQILVATDVAARGIDVEEITHVINLDVPEAPETYIHRIGRTARGDATGDAFTLVDRQEEPLIRDIERLLKQALPRVTLPDFDYKKPKPDLPHHPPQQHRHSQWRGSHRRQGRP
ncbi:MAG: DEAD/DEAH box helicase [Deltaproteobacteria bacterium]|nr:DEAD/DEAH box helicase [Deltaproteobacteria bacterium]